MPQVRLVHTGQHYDHSLNGQLFEDLGLPTPDVNLEVGSGSHAVQTAEVMKRFEPVMDEHRPSLVLVVGDVNSTLACSLVAVYEGYHSVPTAEGVGRATTRTVVISSVSVLLLDYMLTAVML